mgnify:CR=1 FL=1
MEKVLVTGAAGFIGFYVCNKLLDLGLEVHGVDNLNNYYDPKLKKSRLEILTNQKMPFSKIDLANNEKINELFHNFKPTVVINLAAQAGVRYSLENPHAYINSNIVGFLNILECCRNHSVEHLIYASSSSVYGLNKVFPFSEDNNVDHPVSLYAASKKSNEAMAHSYSHIFGLPSTGLRFFTVYGPWGRPDMALYIFTRKILTGEPIDVFGHGRMKRDFTYIDDIVEGIIRLIDKKPSSNPNWSRGNPDPSTSSAPWSIFNIGNNKPTELEYFISIIEKNLGKKAIKNYLDMQPGDVSETAADIQKLNKITGFTPEIKIEDGIPKFLSWYKDFHN